MEQLVRIEERDGKQLVSARELHAFLESTERFSRWFERKLEYGFQEGVDFTSVSQLTVVGNGAEKEIGDYAITLDMAKELSMLQKNAKGKQARRYFIQCETKVKQAHKILTEAKKHDKFFKRLTGISRIRRERRLQQYQVDRLMYDACVECGIDPSKYLLPSNDVIEEQERDPYLVDGYLNDCPIDKAITISVLFNNYLKWFKTGTRYKDRYELSRFEFKTEIESRGYKFVRRSSGCCCLPK